MSSHKNKHFSPLPWLTGDERKRTSRTPFIAVDATLLQDQRFQSLTASAQFEYFCLALEAKGNREFEFPQHLAASKYGICKSAHWRNIARLEEHGFIERTSGRTTRENNIYHFSLSWKNG